MRPHLRIPLWAALAIPGAAYVVRSVFVRSGDFAPDLPQDAIVASALLVAIAVAVALRR